jgi:XTP/dITP diphosphohydrolase
VIRDSDPGSLVLATRNPHKVREFDRLLGPMGLHAQPLAEWVTLPPEDGETFAANALGKARAAAAATGQLAIADDSGIEAAVLDGRPGVRSARFAGEHATDADNLAMLLARAPAHSPLRYVCALAFVDPISRQEHVVHGNCTGTVAATPSGAGGFGYDPAFVPDGDHGGRTMAQLSDAEKDALSHRGEAVRELTAWLAARGAQVSGPGTE